MTPDAHASFTRALVDAVDDDPEVVGLVGLGSTASDERPPDAHSDHDVFVVCAPARVDHYLQPANWLPRPDELVLGFCETEHGVKAMYRDGHLVEYAVFTLDELGLARTNAQQVLLDRRDLDRRMHEVRAATVEAVGRETRPAEYHLGQFLTLLAIGAARHQRGEQVSANAFVRGFAVDHLCTLLWRELAVDHPLRDDLNPTRRIEAALPGPGGRVAAALGRPLGDAALELLDVAHVHLSHLAPAYVDAWSTVRNGLQNVRG